MGTTFLKRSAHAKTFRVSIPIRTTLGAAVSLALYGLPHPAFSQDLSEGPPTPLSEVIVTANRRVQTLEEVPYSLSVVSADQISNTGVTDIASLTSQVPGLSMYNLGARESGATTPIIRGINVTAAPASYSAFRTFEQSPVGIYIGNSPIDGYFQLDDVQRLEVLRGPQGTLYGAGALGGALRIIPNEPELGKFAGSLEVGGGTLAHSSGVPYSISGVLNIPMGDTLALRISGKYAYEPGFIDAYGILERTGTPLSGVPVLANPAEPATSSGIFTGKKDWNDQNTFTGRASLLWKPADPFSANLAFMYAHLSGNGGPTANSTFPGGAYPIDPSIKFPPGGNYQEFTTIDQPFTRRTELTSLDLSYDAGFATVSSTSSYFTTRGSTLLDGTYVSKAYFDLFPSVIGYYAGNPFNPRFINDDLYQDYTHTFTQEVRLVSNTHPGALFDYVLGVFYENQGNVGSWDDANPGTPEYSAAQGCTSPYVYPGTFPNCQIISGPGDIYFFQSDTQKFQDKSVFGELTWHFVTHGQLTVGARHFDQSFTDSQTYHSFTFDYSLPETPINSPASKNIWKINPSYEYAKGHHVYALWSQGFRRGGANSLPTNPPHPTGENPVLVSYGPDTTNNYEAGLKGRFATGITYTLDVFDIQWDNPQIAGSTPAGNLAVWNAKKAQSKGLEFDVTSPLFLPGLSITAGGSYTDATFSKDYTIVADVYGNITGQAGQQLPGSPKLSAVATLNYSRILAPGYDLLASLNDTYRSGEFLSTFPIAGQTQPLHISGMDIVNVSASVSHQSWRLGVYVTNLTDKRVVLAPPSLLDLAGNLTNDATINPPREIELRLKYSFGIE
jgi:outer membrane receptor protein involved in Fe transport